MKIFNLKLIALSAVIFLLLSGGCNRLLVYSEPALFEAKGKLQLCLRRNEPPGNTEDFVLFSRDPDMTPEWSAQGQYSGQPAGVFLFNQDLVSVYPDGRIVLLPDGTDKSGSASLCGPDPSLRLICALERKGKIIALDVSVSGKIRILELREEKWEECCPPLAVTASPVNAKMLEYQGRLVILWQGEIGGRLEPELKINELTGENWEVLPPPSESKTGDYTAAVREEGDSEVLLLLRERSLSFAEASTELSLDEFDGKGWKKIQPLPLPEKFRLAQPLGLALKQFDGELHAVRADSMGVHWFRLSGQDYRLVKEPSDIISNDNAAANSVFPSFFLALAMLLMFMLTRRMAAKVAKARASEMKIFTGGFASLFERAAAMLIDLALLLPLPVFYYARSLGLDGSEDPRYLMGVSSSPEAGFPSLLLWLGGHALYAACAEARWGQTVGKALMKIRVRSASGGPITLRQALIRNLLRIVDFWPVPLMGTAFPYLIALFCASFTRRRQRVGDLFAQTVVMKKLPLEERELVLASSSPRRKELLSGLNLQYRVLSPEVDEGLKPGEEPQATAMRLAMLKAETAAGKLSGYEIIIAADTIVVHEGAIIGKPVDRADACAILNRLSGNSHQVLTGVAIIDRATGQHLCACEDTTVEMRTLSEVDILGYVDSGEADGKAGAYAIQESGDRFVHNVDGSLSNVIGLPMEMLRKMLNEIDT